MQIAPESSPESSAKSLSQKFFGVPFLSLTHQFKEVTVFKAVGICCDIVCATLRSRDRGHSNGVPLRPLAMQKHLSLDSVC